jgi:putative ABC transport system permease protein
VKAYLLRAAAKEVRAGRLPVALAVAGVALGVASVISIQLLNQGALGTFAGTVRAVSGNADLSVLGWAGALDEALLPEVLAVPGVRSALPLWRAEAALDGHPDRGLEIVGADLLAAARAPGSDPRGEAASAAGAAAEGWAPAAARIGDALGSPGWVAVTPELAAEMGWQEGTRVGVSLGSRRATLTVGALVDLRRVAPLASRRLAVMDLAQAQGLLGVRGRIHQIDVVAAPGTPPAPQGAPSEEAASPRRSDLDELAARLSAALGGRARVATPEQRTVEAAGLLAAFRLNLTALSLVSVLVGGFLVHASVRASLARRREEIGILRAVGATRGQVLRLILAEAAALGAAGTALGIPLGWLAARANLAAVSGTIRTLYLLEGVERVAVGPGVALLAVATGVGGAIAGAALPALDASREDPRALLSPLPVEERSRAGAARLLAGGAGALVLALAGYLALGRLAAAGFALALGVLAAVPLAAPAALAAMGGWRRPRRLGARWGLRTLAARPSGAAVAAGALAVAVSMLVGVTVMVGSFRASVQRWLAATLRADVYVTSPSWRRSRSEATLAPEVVERLRAEPGLVALDLLRQVHAYAGTRRIAVSGVNGALPGGERQLDLVAGEPARALRALRAGAVLVSEPLARKEGLAPGGTLTVRGPRGAASFEVAAVYRDYGSEAGAATLDLPTFARAFGEGPPSNAALHLAPGADPEAAVARLRADLRDHALLVRSNRALRGEVLAIFEQTFAVTRLLQAMGLVIAAAGVTLSLLVLARERRAELALYRALGASRAQLARIFLGRGLAIGVAGLALGAGGGAGLALVLVRVVNPSFFGWTLGVDVPWGALAAQAGTILAAAAAASLQPSLVASRTPAQELSRDAL